MATLLIAEHDNKSLKDATNKALTAAAALGAEAELDIVFADGNLPVRRIDRGRSAKPDRTQQGSLL